MKVALVTRHKAASNVFGMLESALEERGVEVVSQIGDGQPFELDTSLIEGADLLLAGMSAPEEHATEELAAIHFAIERNILVGLFADTHAAVARPYFEDVRSAVGLVLTVNDDEACEADRLFPNAQTVVTGQPEWDTFFFPSADRDEVRAKLGVEDDEIMVLVPFGKEPVVNVLHLGGVVDGVATRVECAEGDDPKNFRIVVGLHPGEPEGSRRLYEAIADLSSVPMVIVGRGLALDISGPDLVPASDLVIESASGIGKAAVCQRKPVISYFTEVALARLERANGSRDWEPCEQGVQRYFQVFDSGCDLDDEIEEILDPHNEDTKELHERQKEYYPKPEKPGESLTKMADVVASFSVS